MDFCFTVFAGCVLLIVMVWTVSDLQLHELNASDEFHVCCKCAGLLVKLQCFAFFLHDRTRLIRDNFLKSSGKRQRKTTLKRQDG